MTYREDEMQGEPREIMRPLSVGTTLIYYSREKCLNIQAVVKASSFYFLWVVDVEESDVREHFIAYGDIVSICATR
jgi:hypothetical protein